MLGGRIVTYVSLVKLDDGITYLSSLLEVYERLHLVKEMVRFPGEMLASVHSLQSHTWPASNSFRTFTSQTPITARLTFVRDLMLARAASDEAKRSLRWSITHLLHLLLVAMAVPPNESQNHEISHDQIDEASL